MVRSKRNNNTQEQSSTKISNDEKYARYSTLFFFSHVRYYSNRSYKRAPSNQNNLLIKKRLIVVCVCIYTRSILNHFYIYSNFQQYNFV